ncbi:MAG: hypoxanthine phosphoribosyltransferase [Fimbriimonadales bacterium]
MPSVASEQAIKEAVHRLAGEVSASYTEPPVLIGVLKGSFVFMADLVRELDLDCEVDFICISSYEGTSHATEVELRFDTIVPLEGREVLIVEDIVDSGRTLDWLRSHISHKGAARVRVVTMFFKPKAFSGEIAPEFVGISIPNEFVVGYGLDLNEKGRGRKSVTTI